MTSLSRARVWVFIRFHDKLAGSPQSVATAFDAFVREGLRGDGLRNFDPNVDKCGSLALVSACAGGTRFRIQDNLFIMFGLHFPERSIMYWTPGAPPKMVRNTLWGGPQHRNVVDKGSGGRLWGKLGPWQHI